MKMYGLTHSKHGLLGLCIYPNGDNAEFCNSTTVTLEKWYPGQALYLVSDQDIALSVIDNPPEWYNSTVECPRHDYPSRDLHIYEIEVPDN